MKMKRCLWFIMQEIFVNAKCFEYKSKNKKVIHLLNKRNIIDIPTAKLVQSLKLRVKEKENSTKASKEYCPSGTTLIKR